MNSTGLLGICGVPGSGKTLLTVILAIAHYKWENLAIKYYVAKLKYKVIQKLKNNEIIMSIYNKILNIKSYKFFNSIVYKVIKFIIKWSINIFLFTCLFFQFNLYIKAAIIFYLFFLKKFIKSFNSLDYTYYCLFPYNKINNVYSSYPIILDKKRNIETQKLHLYDMDGKHSFYPNSLLIIDEVQLFVDSDEYKDKDKKKLISMVAKFLQAHRHFGIKQILYVSQSPSRIFKKARNITVGYLKLCKVINLPFNISIMRGIIYYDFEYYGRYIPRDREERKKLPFEYKKVRKIFIRSNVYNRYDSRYLSEYNYNKPLLDRGTWDSMKVDYEYLRTMFEDYD